MHEIKFRAWDPAGKKMYQHASISSLGKVDFCWNGTHQRLGLTSYPGRTSEGVRYDDMVPMQFTGLKDKHGKEIYEGDIIMVPKYILGAKPAYEEPHQVIFERGVFGLKPTHNVTPLCETEMGIADTKKYISNYGEVYTEYRPTVEVIGNIYENPELLSPSD